MFYRIYAHFRLKPKHRFSSTASLTGHQDLYSSAAHTTNFCISPNRNPARYIYLLCYISIPTSSSFNSISRQEKRTAFPGSDLPCDLLHVNKRYVLRVVILQQYIWCFGVWCFLCCFVLRSFLLQRPLDMARHPQHNQHNPIVASYFTTNWVWEDRSTKRRLASRVTWATPSTTEPSKILFCSRLKGPKKTPRPPCLHSPGRLLMTRVPGFNFDMFSCSSVFRSAKITMITKQIKSTSHLHNIRRKHHPPKHKIIITDWICC